MSKEFRGREIQEVHMAHARAREEAAARRRRRALRVRGGAALLPRGGSLGITYGEQDAIRRRNEALRMYAAIDKTLVRPPPRVPCGLCWWCERQMPCPAWRNLDGSEPARTPCGRCWWCKAGEVCPDLRDRSVVASG